MTIMQALRKLYEAITGETPPATATTISKLLVALADNWPTSFDSSSES